MSISVPLLGTASKLLDDLIRNLKYHISSQVDLDFYNSAHTKMMDFFGVYKTELLEIKNNSYKNWAEQKNCSSLVNANLSENTNNNTASQRNSQRNHASQLNNNNNNGSQQNNTTQHNNNNGNIRMQNVAETEIKLRKSKKREMIIILRNIKSSVDHIKTLFKKIECSSNLVTKESLRVTEKLFVEPFLNRLVFQLEIYTQHFVNYSRPV